MNKIMMTALVLMGWTRVWAGDVTVIVKPSSTAGTVVASDAAAGQTCTLTVKPASGYYLTKENLTAVTVVSGAALQGPRKAIDIKSEPVEISADSGADPSGETTYTFTMPEDDNIGVEVTAEFQTLIAITPTVTLQGWTYGENANTPVVEGNPGNGEVTFTYAVKGSTTFTNAVPENVGDYTVKASVAAAMQYAAGEATADFSISKAVASVTKAPAANTLTYTGEAQALVATGETTSGTLMYSLSNVEGFSESIPTGTDADKYTVYYFVQADANHTNSDTLSVEVTIAAKPLTEEMIADIADQIYTGRAVEPEVTVKHGDKVLKLDTDYTIAYADNIKVGTASFSITGKGNYTGTVTKQYSIVAIEYGLMVNGIVVTNANCDDVLGNESHSVTFDSDENQLVLNDAELQEITTSLEQLTIYLVGKNNQVGEIKAEGEGDHKLTFTTDGSYPGSVTIGSVNSLNEFYVEYEGGLVLDGNTVATKVNPLVNNSGEEKTVNVGDVTLPDDQILNTTIEDVLYTMDKSHDDGIDNNIVVLGSAMTIDYISNAITNFVPGSIDYAENFSGLTIMVSAGMGHIIINASTGENGVLGVQIGDGEPYLFVHLTLDNPVSIAYAVPEATYVRIFNASEADMNEASRRAGKKTSTTIGIRTVGVKAKVAQASNPPSKNNVPQEEQVSTDEVNDLVQTDINGKLTISDTDAFGVVTLPENMLAGEPYSPSVDFRNTNVTGLFVSRTTGVFTGVSENTFIFMPAGNNTDEANIVIGAVCLSAKLDGNMKDGEQFAPADEFTAQRAELTTSFQQGQLSTVYLPFAVTAADAAQWGTFYTFNGIERGYVKIKETTDDLQPNVPYLFKAFENGTKITTGVADIVLPQGNGAQRRTDGDKLVGCYSHQTAADGMYLLRNEGSDFKFEKMQAGDKIKPFQAYLNVESDNSTILQVTDNDEVPTGIVSVKNETNNVIWQTLSGMTLDKKPKEKGVYIRNGKKIVVR